ncbi:MAG: exo-alpha-sialidase, partial [Draconibacterium sp.]|nr:exo-alpha-sialidase [Draconibacterium sp.]
SKDGGKTWDIEHEIILKHAINGDLGYPASVQLGDGIILTIYYEIDKKGEKTCLMGTKWSLK